MLHVYVRWKKRGRRPIGDNWTL